MKKLYVSFVLCLIIFQCMVGHLAAQTYQWRSLSMGGAGFVSGLITSNGEQNLMYARTDVGGAYKWNAATSTWKPLQDWLADNQSGFYGVESIAIDPHATSKLYMLVGISYFNNGKSAILKSDDYGQTFTTIDVTSQFKAHGNGMGRSNGERLQVDPNLGSTLYVGTRYNGLFKSTDAGLTWNRLSGLNITSTPNENGISFVTIDSASGSSGVASQKIYVGVSRYDTLPGIPPYNLYVSINAGATFTPVTGGPSGFMPQRAKLLSNGDMIINYANGAGPYGKTYTGSNEPMDKGGIWKYATGTGTWTNITPAGITRAWGGITVDPNNPARMMASTINTYWFQYNSAMGAAYGDYMYLTTNGGATWTDVVSRGFSLDPAGTWILGGAIHWAGSIEFDPFNTAKVYVISGNGVFSNSNIDVASTPWKFEVKGLEETVPTDMVSIPGGPFIATIGDYDGFRFTNLNQYGDRLFPRIGSNSAIAYAATVPNKLVRVGRDMYISTDQGITWTKTTAALPPAGPTASKEGKLAMSADGTRILYCPSGSNLTYYSTNDGASWTACTPNIMDAYPVADKVNSGIFYMYNSGSGNLNRTLNGGASFAVTVNIGAGGNKFIRAIPGMEGHIWAAMNGGGLKRSINSGTSFTTIAGVTACSAVGYGKAAPGATYLTLYIWGTVGGVTGIFRSVDEGITWTRINDNTHQFGGPGNAGAIMGDMNTFGIVYMSTVGRGVIIGEEAPASPLPVSLVSFSVRQSAQNNRAIAQLTWNTASENNAGYFAVERSFNRTEWTAVGSVNSKAVNGNSSTPLQYDYNDDITGIQGMIYYRLRMVDKDGHYKTGNVVSLTIGGNIHFVMAVVPNPVAANAATVLQITSDKAQRILIKLITGNGVVAGTRSVNLLQGNTNLNLTELANKPAGFYLVNVVAADSNETLGTTHFIKQ